MNNNSSPTSQDSSFSPTNTEWLPLDKRRLVRFVLGGKIIVIKPTEHPPTIPLFCSVCEFPFRNVDDAIAFRSNGDCCYRCELRWRNTNLKRWTEEGWRPDKESELWKTYIQERHDLAKIPIVFA